MSKYVLLFSRSCFDDIRVGIELTNDVIAWYRPCRQSVCAVRCAKEPHCKSFSVCYKNLCKLNSVDILELEMDNNTVANSECIYGGKSALTMPICEENGEEKDIQGICI